jgi:hypothetical protein
MDAVNDYYVYAHYIPNNNIPFYIGKGRGRRYKKTDNRNKWWHHIVSKYGIEFKILHTHLTESAAAELEMKLIKQYGRKDLGTGVLVNMTDGGETSTGYKHDKKTKNIIGEYSVKNWKKKSAKERHQIGLRRWENMSEENKKLHAENTKKSLKKKWEGYEKGSYRWVTTDTGKTTRLPKNSQLPDGWSWGRPAWSTETKERISRGLLNNKNRLGSSKKDID